MALFSSGEANASTIILIEREDNEGTFKVWNFSIVDTLDNVYKWQSTVENLGYGSTPTDANIKTYIHDYLTGTDTTATYDGVTKKGTKQKKMSILEKTHLMQIKVTGGVRALASEHKILEPDAYTTNTYGNKDDGESTYNTFTASDTTPSVRNGNYWNTHTGTLAITDFDEGYAGQHIYVISKGAITYDVTSSGLKGGTTDLVTASGDLTCWLYDGTDWILTQFTDHSDDLS